MEEQMEATKARISNLWREQALQGYDQFDFDEPVNTRDIPNIVEVLKALQIKRFTISSKSGCVDMVAAFNEAKCAMVGMTKIKHTSDEATNNPYDDGLKNACLMEVL